MHDGHFRRIREKAMSVEPYDFDDTLLSEIVLQCVFKRTDTNEIAKALLAKYGTFLCMAKNAVPKDLKEIRGIGENSAEKLCALLRAMYSFRMVPGSAVIPTQPIYYNDLVQMLYRQFENLDYDMQSELFVKINGEQEKVKTDLLNSIVGYQNWNSENESKQFYAIPLMLANELNDNENDTKIDYEHKSIPFILTVDKILSLIRNLTIREMPGNTLFPDTMKQYDDYSIREALHNCIAHQDYTLQERITLIEQPGSLLFSNGGTFLPQTLENALEQDGPQKYYRNFCLCQGMVNFNMIDTIGRGIKKIFTEQQKRFFPMPDYVIDCDKKEVKVRIYGKMIDEKYVELLKQIPDLSLNECIALDCVQKHKPIQADIAKKLKAKGYIEKIKSEWFISEYIARETKQLPDYVKQKGLGRKYYKDMVLRLLSKNKNGLGREDIDNLLLDMVPKFSKNPSSYIGNLLSEMKNKDNTIYLDGNRWKIDEK